MSFPKYPKYKNSGIEWLGELPEHWDVMPLKHVASLKGRLGWQGLRADEYTEDGPFLVTSEHFLNDEIDWSRCYHVSQERYDLAPEIQLRPHDLLMMKDGAAMGKLAYVDSLPGPACLNSHLLLFRPLDGRFINRFLYYFLGCPIFATYMAQERTGTTFFGISQESIGVFPFALPPIAEQCLIVHALDSEMAKIDALVAEQRLLIELLKEKRQALISHAVTKGLNPEARMKSSGIESLGDLPEHWTVCPLMRLTPDDRQIMYGIVLPGPHVEEGVPVVKGGDVRPERLNPEMLSRTTREIESGYVRSRLCGGDIVYAIRGSIGEAAIVPDSLTGANLTQDAARIAPRSDVDAEWLLFVLQSQSVFAQLEQTVNGATIRGINIYQLKRGRIPCPPLIEQKAIATFLRSEISKVDCLIAGAERAIDLLKERRTALISAGVTGQIDVRGIAETVTA
jgi:type I restriction enzyme S subunit